MDTKIITETRIEGDLEFDGRLVFKETVEITGSLRARQVLAEKSIVVLKSYTVYETDEVGGYQKVGGSQKVGEYQNMSFEVVDTNKVKATRIIFTSTYYHERRFWLAQLEPVEGIKEVKDAIKDERSCWDTIISTAKKHKEKILSYEHFVPAVRQAIEIMLA